MSESDTKEKSVEVNTTETTISQTVQEKITPMRCFSGSAISGGLAFVAYLLTKSVIVTYATMPIEFNNPMAIRIATTVRTLIMGLTIMATFLFGMVTVGLIALGIKLILDDRKANQA